MRPRSGRAANSSSMGRTGVMPTPVTPNTTSPACCRSRTKKPMGPVKRTLEPGFRRSKNSLPGPPLLSFRMNERSGGPGDRPVHPPTGATGEWQGALPRGHPPIVPGATMGGSGATAGGAGFEGTTPGGDFDAKTLVAGVIKLDSKMKDKVADGDTIFV